MILAGIDIGTNSLRLLIAETGPDTFHEIYSDRRITRLGQDLERTGLLSRGAADRSLDALLSFSRAIREQGALHTAAVGTSALRNAANAGDFISRTAAMTGLAIRVASGREEAQLTLLGVVHALKDSPVSRTGSAVIVDIGGGSTEIIVTHPRKVPVTASLPLGAVYLTERFVRHDPPAGDEARGLRDAVREIVRLHCGRLNSDAAGVFIGTAGTATTMAAMEQRMTAYDPRLINGYVMTRDAVQGIIDRLSGAALAERRAMPGLERGREDIIYAGAVVAGELMDWFSAGSMIVSDGGLREGILLDLYRTLQHTEGR